MDLFRVATVMHANDFTRIEKIIGISVAQIKRKNATQFNSLGHMIDVVTFSQLS